MVKETISIRELKGILPKPEKPVSIEDMNRAIGDAVMEKWRRFERQSRSRKDLRKTSSK